MKGKKKAIGIIVLAIVITLGAIFYIRQNNHKIWSKNDSPTNTEPISYSLTGISASVSKEIKSFDFTAAELASDAEECGAKHDAGYFDALVSKFSGSSKIIYDFKYQGNNQDGSTFVVTLLPNKAGYTSIDQFKKDFDVCAVGGQTYPQMLSSDWLLFVNSCGSGFDDGSGRIHGCDEIRKIIEPSLRFN